MIYNEYYEPEPDIVIVKINALDYNEFSILAFEEIKIQIQEMLRPQ
ncbi:hypothetical protein CWATWH0401_2187 [Crocosphaera watsonii WH 0401]|uniref:Uncharacterized protein n=1 Tax=Crocosphaera watsonii WH 0401 TaxID=555881 RepID=T2J7Q2_CROWT|nr:hypothetical protein CWATWH0401_2187 [Crocosphaera watsonii WH 0401]